MRHPLFALSASAIHSLLLTALVLVSPIGHAEAPVDRLMELSGLAAQLDGSPVEAAKTFSDEFKRSSAFELGDDFESMVRQVFTDNTAREDAHTAMAANLSSSEIDQLLTWYESDIGRKIAALEVAAVDPAQAERMMAQMNSLLADTDNMARARRLDQLLGSTDLTMQAMETIQLALLGAMLDGQDTPQANQEMIFAQVKQSVAASRPEMEQFTLAQTAYTYRALQDAEYEAYLQFLETPESTQFYKVVTNALSTSTSKTYAKLGASIKARLDALKTAQANAEPTAT